jgi:hypothetical protein
MLAIKKSEIGKQSMPSESCFLNELNAAYVIA